MIYIFLCDGYESTEAVTTAGILRRAKFDVRFVGVESKVVRSMFGLKIETDISIDEVDKSNIEAIVLPGGMPGTTNLESNDKVREIINFCFKNRVLICAICAAPSIIGKMGLLSGKVACCYPGFEKFLVNASISYDNVCVDDKIVTSRGPGTAIDFGLSIVSILKNKRAASLISDGVQYKKYS